MTTCPACGARRTLLVWLWSERQRRSVLRGWRCSSCGEGFTTRRLVGNVATYHTKHRVSLPMPEH